MTRGFQDTGRQTRRDRDCSGTGTESRRGDPAPAPAPACSLEIPGSDVGGNRAGRLARPRSRAERENLGNPQTIPPSLQLRANQHLHVREFPRAGDRAIRTAQRTTARLAALGRAPSPKARRRPQNPRGAGQSPEDFR